VTANLRDVNQMLARLVIASGFVSVGSGMIAWMVVRSQIAAERIVIPESAPHLPGRVVEGPFSAYAEAHAIQRGALAATGGKTYGEIEEGHPSARVALDASLLRASLFTSILAFGVAALQVAFGAVLVVIGTALSGRPRGGRPTGR
jgi:hypothetical protein